MKGNAWAVAQQYVMAGHSRSKNGMRGHDEGGYAFITPNSLFGASALCLGCVSVVGLLEVHAPFWSGALFQAGRTLSLAGFTDASHQRRAVFIRFCFGCLGSCQRGPGRNRFGRRHDWLDRFRLLDWSFSVEIPGLRASRESHGKKCSEWPTHLASPSSKVRPHPAASCARGRR